jgi:hypothetical protein
MNETIQRKSRLGFIRHFLQLLLSATAHSAVGEVTTFLQFPFIAQSFLVKTFLAQAAETLRPSMLRRAKLE